MFRRDDRPARRRGWGDPYRAAAPQAVLYYGLAVLLSVVGGVATSRWFIAAPAFALALGLAVCGVAQLAGRRFADANRWALRGFLLACAVLVAGLLTQREPHSARDCAPNDTHPICFGIKEH